MWGEGVCVWGEGVCVGVCVCRGEGVSCVQMRAAVDVVM